MKEFLKSLNSLYWWISVVVVGILINLVSAYLKNKLDKQLSTVSSWWRIRSEARRSKRLEELKRLRANPQEQLMLAIDELRGRIRSIFNMIMGLVAILLGAGLFLFSPNYYSGDVIILIFKIVFMLGGVISIIVGLREWFTTVQTESLLFDVRDEECGGKSDDMGSTA